MEIVERPNQAFEHLLDILKVVLTIWHSNYFFSLTRSFLARTPPAKQQAALDSRQIGHTIKRFQLTIPSHAGDLGGPSGTVPVLQIPMAPMYVNTKKASTTVGVLIGVTSTKKRIAGMTPMMKVRYSHIRD